MQGVNSITMQCIYSTPCGWCVKWDKKCDKKIGCDVKPVFRLRDNKDVDWTIKDFPLHTGRHSW